MQRGPARLPRVLIPMQTEYHGIYLSPHLDDAVLSCGGQIWRQATTGRPALIVTPASGDPAPGPLSDLAASVLDLWGLSRDEVMSVRRAEDIDAGGVLGADTLHAEVFEEALYRRLPGGGEPLYPTFKDLLAQPHGADATLVGRLTDFLAEHRLVRQAAERFRPEGLLYYEEFPYADHRFAVRKTIGLGWGWRRLALPLSEQALAARVRAICCYSSQIGPAFGDREALSQRLRRYVRRAGGERLWWRRGSIIGPAQ